MNRKPRFYNALEALVGAEKLAGGCTDGPISKINPVDGLDLPTDEEVQIKLTSMINDWNAQEYSRKRAEVYDSYGNQLDMLFHDMTAGKGDKTGKWYEAIAKVKSDHPKPE